MADAARPSNGLNFATMLGYAVCALFVALVADIMQPMGPFVLYLAVVFVVVAIVCALLSFAPPLRGVMRAAASFALLSVLIYGVFFALQSYLAPQPAGERRGFLAAMVPPAQDVQRWILAEAKKREDLNPEPAAAAAPAPVPAVPATPVGEAMLRRLQAAMTGADPVERAAASGEALASPEPAVVQAAADMLYRSADPRLRILATRKLIAMRAGRDRLPLLATGEGEATPLAAALQAGGVTVKAINETSGAFSGGLCGPSGMSGTVNLANVILTGKCRVGAEEQTVTMVLTTSDDFRLIGEATNEKGQKARVELSLS